MIEDDHLGQRRRKPSCTRTVGGRERWAATRSVAKALGPDLRLAVLAGDPQTIARVQGRQQCGPGLGEPHPAVPRARASGATPPSQALDRAARAPPTPSGARRSCSSAWPSAGVPASGASGLNVWVPVDDEAGVVGALLQRGWVVAPGAPYRLAGSSPGDPRDDRHAPRARGGAAGRRPRRRPRPGAARAAADSRSCRACQRPTSTADRARAPLRLRGAAARVRARRLRRPRRCRPRPSELDARDRALAMRLAYGAVQRRGTLDHLIERFAERPPSASTRPCSRRCASGCMSCSTWAARPTTRSWPTPWSSPRRRAGAGHGLVNAVLRRAAREGRGAARRADRRHARAGGASSTPTREWIARLWWEELGRDGRARADGLRQRARRGGAARQHARHRRRPRWPPSCRSTDASATPTSPRRSCWTGPSTCTARRCGARARSSPSRARRCSWPARSTRSRASGCSTCAPRRAARAPIWRR